MPEIYRAVICYILQGIALTITVLCFLQKQQKNSSIMHGIGCILFGIALFLSNKDVNSLVGVIAYLIAATRGFIFSFRNSKKWASNVIWIYIFSLTFVINYVLQFTLLRKEPTAINLLIQLLPTVGSVFATLAFHTKNAHTVRLLYLLCAPLWFTYNVITMQWLAVISEGLNFVSSIVGIIIIDNNKKINKEK